VKERQIEEMFEKLDTNKSNALDMKEMSELLNENGVTMTKKQVTEMFSACKRFFSKRGNF
jgi:Ca2+-binding EF-hand superfamily protein